MLVNRAEAPGFFFISKKSLSVFTSLNSFHAILTPSFHINKPSHVHRTDRDETAKENAQTVSSTFWSFLEKFRHTGFPVGFFCACGPFRYYEEMSWRKRSPASSISACISPFPSLYFSTIYSCKWAVPSGLRSLQDSSSPPISPPWGPGP